MHAQAVRDMTLFCDYFRPKENQSQLALEIPGFLPQFEGAMPHFRQIIPSLACFSGCVVLAFPAGAKDEAAMVEELRATIGGIIELQSQTSKELRDWEARKETMDALLEIHRREIALLSEELETSGRSAPGHDDAVTLAEQDIAALRATRAKLTTAVESARPRVLALAARFPRPLANDVDGELAVLSAWKSGDEPREALQPLLGVLSKAAQFNRRVTRSLEIVDDREVEVIYLGLTRAFYADRSGVAGIGLPTADGWEWRADASLNRRVLRAFEILDQKRPPSRIDLPLHIE